MMSKSFGFTLIELAISLTIIGILVVAVLKGQTLIESSRVNAAIKLSEDYSEAIHEFKMRYRLWPGDMPNPPIANLIAGCVAGGDGRGSINGPVDAFPNTPSESQCIPEVLSKAGMIKTDGVENGYPVVKSHWGYVWAKAITTSQVIPNNYPASVQHVIEFENLTCEAANAIDRKIDDGNLITGRVEASLPNCTGNDIVPYLAIAI